MNLTPAPDLPAQRRSIPHPAAAQIGVDIRLDDIDGRSRTFVDLARAAKWNTPVRDDAGWPAADATATFFDLRSPSLRSDPQRAIPDYSGRYLLSFRGRATVAGAAVENLTYDETTNTTTGEVLVPPAAELLELSFTGTRRTSDAATNTGITGVRLIRPGYRAEAAPLYTSEFLRSLAPFQVLSFRYLFLDSNNETQPPYPNTTERSDRHLPGDATQQQYGPWRNNGPAFEHSILLANLTGKDLWLSIPASASDGYVTELATLLRDTLRPELKVYLEYSQTFYTAANPGYRYADAAISAAPADPELHHPVPASRSELIFRWHARRLIQIGRLFRSVFGDDGASERLRIVARWWQEQGAFPIEDDRLLRWVDQHFGPPANHFYGLSAYHMFYDLSAPGSDEAAILRSYRDSAAAHALGSLRPLIARVAEPWKLKTLVYSGGPTLNVSLARPAHADAFNQPAIGEILRRDIEENWAAAGGDLYVHFGLAGSYDRLLLDAGSLDRPQFNAIRALAGIQPLPQIGRIGAGDGAFPDAPLVSGGRASLRGQDLASRTVSWDLPWPEWAGAFPNALDGVIVRIAGQDCPITLVSPERVDFLVPSGLSPGNYLLELFTNSGQAGAEVAVTSGGS
jgi:hypothetical protein